MAVRRAKRPGKGKNVEVSIGLGALQPNSEQVARLKAYMECQVLTWIRADLNDNRQIVVHFHEQMHPPEPIPGG